MPSFLLRRALSSVIVIFCVISITFVLARITKGGPFDREKEPPPHIKEALLTRYKLNGTLWEQYSAYVGSLMRFDLGLSTRYRDWRVSELLQQKMPNSFALGGLALVIASCAGVGLGSLAAMKKDTWVDRSAMLCALMSISVPSFVSGPVLIAVFALWLGWLPVGGWGTARQMILPAVCLAAPYVAYIARLMRNSLLDVMKSDFLRTARAKGLSETQAVVKHAVKVAILPVVTFLGPLAAHLLTGSMIVESVFNISGAGMIFVNSIQNRDVFLLGGAVIVYCVLLVLFNLLVDVIYTLLDKRIRLYA
ncbi:MAG: ABC transporter permease [Prosthecobacter sp.]|jgi:oligopeptide transport system permease protein|uniref:ABC transporter permease n=1 Tax=Prosthecobacter sp. TaxID=1965333 RepID=UPI0019EDB66C|nr:ABC transporter permease [Prosthecobacter sp.]MBE2283929.1 ABC transporter permease [Prosthecobacter sp.]